MIYKDLVERKEILEQLKAYDLNLQVNTKVYENEEGVLIFDGAKVYEINMARQDQIVNKYSVFSFDNKSFDDTDCRFVLLDEKQKNLIDLSMAFADSKERDVFINLYDSKKSIRRITALERQYSKSDFLLQHSQLIVPVSILVGLFIFSVAVVCSMMQINWLVGTIQLMPFLLYALLGLAHINYYKNNITSSQFAIGNMLLPLGMSVAVIAHVHYLLQQKVDVTNTLIAIVIFMLIGFVTLCIMLLSNTNNKIVYEEEIQSKKEYETAMLIITLILICVSTFIICPFVLSSYNIAVGDYSYFSFGIFLIYFVFALFTYFVNRYQMKYIRLVTSALILALGISFSFPTALNMNLTYKTKSEKEKQKGLIDSYWSYELIRGIKVLNGKYYLDGEKTNFSEDRGKVIDFTKLNDAEYKVTIEYYSAGTRLIDYKTVELWKKTSDGFSVVGSWMKDKTMIGQTGIIFVNDQKEKNEELEMKVGKNTLKLENCIIDRNYSTQKKESPCLNLYDENGEVIVGGLEYDTNATLITKKITGKYSGGESLVFEEDGSYHEAQRLDENTSQKIGDIEVLYNRTTKLYKVLKKGSLIYTGTFVYYDEKTETFLTRFVEPDFTIQKFDKNMNLIETNENKTKANIYYWKGKIHYDFQ